ncbi:CDGSH iron-sulfur domain-containing protein 3, mitochondrial isoform X2 [Sphaeramia orbicularis]|uniref:CDGSH iron-sulfur domain-containing protein 3, mitochondrial isoform X2 n=1 Tax=Sphaeramia orbicularis TaxID=375764 RepID=UPI001180E4E8|nr:CDGSH iron-sulfur domain-containing protein 3, mitochondrial isoform X2 [Sphaeramia orbicularis]
MTAVWTRAELRWVTGTLRWTRTTAPFPSRFPTSHCLQVQFCTVPPKPVIPSKKPFKVDLVGGKRHSWCTCGYSKKQPFCDGAHKLKAKSFTPLRFFPEKDTTAWLCGCKYTNNPPYCDGTHKQHFIVSAPLHEENDS